MKYHIYNKLGSWVGTVVNEQMAVQLAKDVQGHFLEESHMKPVTHYAPNKMPKNEIGADDVLIGRIETHCGRIVHDLGLISDYRPTCRECLAKEEGDMHEKTMGALREKALR